jgi:photosystem II stability/assembly factor-like uncharacterized protein
MKKITFILALLVLIYCNPILIAQWINQQVPPGDGILLSIDFTNTNNGVATGWVENNEPIGRAIYTTNGGINWMLAAIPDSARSLVNVQMINSYTGYIAGAYNIFSANTSVFASEKLFKIEYSKLKPVSVNTSAIGNLLYDTRAFFLKTTNGGQSWFPYGTFPVNLYYLVAMHFISDLTGFVSASRFSNTIGANGIYKTTNGGLNWSLSYSNTDTVAVNNIYFIDGNTGFAVGYDRILGNPLPIQGLILRTTNSGINWSKQLLPEVNNFTDVSFTNSQTGFSCGVNNSSTIYSGIIYKTTNSGLNWLKLNYMCDTTIFDGIQFYPSSGIGFVYGIEGTPDSLFPGFFYFEHLVIAKTTDYGSTWQEYQTDNTENVYVGNKMVSLNNWFITGGSWVASTKILHTTNGGQIGFEPVSGTVPKSFSLYQNYPNPFNPSTKIKFDVANSFTGKKWVELNIYDILGRQISTLVNENLQPGTYQVDWNASNLPSGVYFCIFKSADYSKSLKMILLK